MMCERKIKVNKIRTNLINRIVQTIIGIFRKSININEISI